LLSLWAPRQPVLGTECAGVVEAVGAGVTRFRVGDAVVAFTGAAMGAHAAYLREARVKQGERVLVIGASGAVGVAAVQLARHGGAEVTGSSRASPPSAPRTCGASWSSRAPASTGR
jgi:NADPH:quinone reductase-like Zn-dependent oxidoreductase